MVERLDPIGFSMISVTKELYATVKISDGIEGPYPVIAIAAIAYPPTGKDGRWEVDDMERQYLVALDTPVDEGIAWFPASEIVALHSKKPLAEMPF